MMGTWRQTVRALERDTAFSVVTVLTLTLAIAATVTVFSLVNGVLLAQLPYPDAERLVEIDHMAPGLDLERMGISPKLYLAYLERGEVFAALALYNNTAATLTDDGTPERVEAVRATPSLFHALGVTASRGRTFSQAEGAPGGADVTVLSHDLWQRRFGGDPQTLGSTIRVNGVPHEVIGIMPAGFAFPRRGAALWLPRVVDPGTAQLGSFNDNALARLAPGLTPAAAETQLTAVTASLAATFPDESSAPILERGGFAPRLETLLDRLVGSARAIMWVLLATVGLILAIACANVANLFLVRVEERGSELAIKSALGASRGLLLRDLLRESVALAVIAGGAGLGLAWLAIRFIVRVGPDIPRLEEVGIDATVFAFALAVSLGAGLLFGLLPALRGTAPKLATFLKEGGRAPTAGRPRQRLRNLLVVAQMALGLVLLITAGLVGRSLLALHNVDPGFQPADALTFRLSLPATDYPAAADRVRFAEEAQARLAALPGVTAVGIADNLPLSNTGRGSGYSVEGIPQEEGAVPPVFMEVFAGPGYMETMGVPLVAGRFLTADDHRLRNGSVVISQSIAQRFWPGESALGKRLTDDDPEEGAPWMTVVGVAGNVRHFGLDQAPRNMIYLPFIGPAGDEAYEKHVGATLSFVLRTHTPPDTLAAALRAEIWELDRNLPIAQVRTLTSMVEDSRARLSFTVTVLLVASLMALVIAAVGLYGVIAYLVSRRTHEIGIRMALGAAAAQTRRMILRQGLGIAVVGAAAGLLLALATTRLLETILYGVGTRDPLTFIVLPLLLLGVALAATYIPAWRASQIEPMEALRRD